MATSTNNENTIKVNPVDENSSKPSMEEKYRKALTDLISEGSLRKLYTKDKYFQIIEMLNRFKVSKTKKTAEEYYFMDQFDVITIGDSQRLIKKLTNSAQDIMVYVHLDEIFHILNAVHQTVGHGGIRKTLIEVKRLYENITFPCVRIFIDLCENCHKKNKSARQRKGKELKKTSTLISEATSTHHMLNELSMAENSVDSSSSAQSAQSAVSNDSGVSSTSGASEKRKMSECSDDSSNNVKSKRKRSLNVSDSLSDAEENTTANDATLSFDQNWPRVEMDSNNDDSTSKVLFSRNWSENQEDVWDDRSLIRAYDRTVNKIKKAINTKLNLGENTSKSPSQAKSSKTATSQRNEATLYEDEDEDDYETEEDSEINEEAPKVLNPSQATKASRAFAVGDLCMAIFSEDGLVYPAKLVKILPSEKCIVKYLYYMNEEEKRLEELFEYQGDDEVEGINPGKAASELKKAEKKLSPLEFLSELNIPPPPLPLSIKNLIGNREELVSQEDALHSMLMSWYMSGYHTGYYLGLNQSGRGQNARK